MESFHTAMKRDQCGATTDIYSGIRRRSCAASAGCWSGSYAEVTTGSLPEEWP